MINRIYLGLLALVMSGSAAAALEQAVSVKYVDESGLVVGQRVALCGNFRGTYGNTHTAYHITEVSNCMGQEQQPASIAPSTHVTAYTLPGNLTIQQACISARCTADSQKELDVFFNAADYGPYNPSI
jgi:hypothetical protein